VERQTLIGWSGTGTAAEENLKKRIECIIRSSYTDLYERMTKVKEIFVYRSDVASYEIDGGYKQHEPFLISGW
jgi:hypothetical protein